MKKFLPFVWACVLAVFSLVSSSCSNQESEKMYDTDMQEAIAIYNQGTEYTSAQEYEKAAECYRIAADYGLDQAQFNLGRAYHSGHGVEQDYTQAAAWYYLAAIQGNPSAHFALSLYYLSELGVEQDNEMFFYWCQQSANQGFADAQLFMSVCYLTGFEVEADLGQSFEMFRKGIVQGNIGERIKKLCSAFALIFIYY